MGSGLSDRLLQIVVWVIAIATIINTFSMKRNSLKIRQHEIQHSAESLGGTYLPYDEKLSLKENMNRVTYGTLKPDLEHRCRICDKPPDRRGMRLSRDKDSWYNSYCRCYERKEKDETSK